MSKNSNPKPQKPKNKLDIFLLIMVIVIGVFTAVILFQELMDYKETGDFPVKYSLLFIADVFIAFSLLKNVKGNKK